MQRVVVTGLGVVASPGIGVPAFWEALAAGRSAIGPLSGVDAGQFRFPNAAQVRDYHALDHFSEKQTDHIDRFAQFGVVAAREALRDSGLKVEELRRRETVIATGTCVGGQSTEDEGFVELYRRGRPRVNPMTVPRVMANAGASHISMDLGLTGPAFTMSTACSSANHAIGMAYWMIRQGSAEYAVTGGCEAPFSFGHLKAWEALRVVSPDTCRPFSQDRRGMILGEGAAMLILESRDVAIARGARIYAEIVGFGMSADAAHITQPSWEGAAKAMRAALHDACIPASEVKYINAHGTGTVANDVTETKAIHNVFGSAPKLAVSSTKSIHGHTLGAAGALEAAATALALTHGTLPPTANYTGPDPECDLDVIPNSSRTAQVEYAMSNSFAFGGLNAVLIFRGRS